MLIWMRWARYVARIGEMGSTRFWWGNLKERDNSECLEIYERVILNWILKKWDGKGWNWLIWRRVETNGGPL